ncbi:MAG TPA: hypothetical protein VIV60_21670, partial [Polyangiaceae bacterium]
VSVAGAEAVSVAGAEAVSVAGAGAVSVAVRGVKAKRIGAMSRVQYCKRDGARAALPGPSEDDDSERLIERSGVSTPHRQK